jgi:hydrogenase/urease accessory protein HupE
VLTLLEALPEIDRDDDGELEEAELQAARALLADYVARHLTVAVDCGETLASGRALTGRLESVALSRGQLRGALPGEPLVDLAFVYAGAGTPRNLGVLTMLFRENDPWHRDHAEIVWPGVAEPATRLLRVEDPLWIHAPGGDSGVLGDYLRLGVEHILTGYDHVAFLLALVVASRRVRSLLLVVTAFTVAHSLTLTAAALGHVDLPPSVVEPVIALSIVWVGARNLLARPPARLWPEAFGFGLVHGLGFAGSVAETLAAERSKLEAVLGFNLGVEVGQLAIVLAVGGLLRALPRSAQLPGHEAVATLAPPRVRRVTAAVVSALGAWWLAERVFGA